MPNLLRKFSLENTERRHGARGEGIGETLEMTLGMQVGISLQRHFTHIPIPARWAKLRSSPGIYADNKNQHFLLNKKGLCNSCLPEPCLRNFDCGGKSGPTGGPHLYNLLPGDVFAL